MNLEKRIKRHVVGARLDLYAVTLPGYESVCRQEIGRLSETVELDRRAKGGIPFSGRLTDVYRANLHLRTAGRILIRLTAFSVTNFRQLQKKAAELAWSLWLPAGTVPVCHVTVHRSRLYHTRAIAERIAGAVAAHWIEAGISPVETSEQALYVRLQDDRLTLSLDSTGVNLYRRGLKTHDAPAPLRETTASAILQVAGYRSGRPLVDPMCGAGTFSLEAALTAKQIAPGLQRNFAFMQWPAFRPRQWAHLTQRAAQERRNLDHPRIWASDLNADACERLTAAVRRHQLADAITVQQCDFFDTAGAAFGTTPGLVVLNPPYGRRLTAGSAGEAFYRDICQKLLDDFKGWRAALIAPHPSWVRSSSLKLKPRALDHGGLKLTLFTGTI